LEISEILGHSENREEIKSKDVRRFGSSSFIAEEGEFGLYLRSLVIRENTFDSFQQAEEFPFGKG
jgi:hypothetical protein